eukprot:CAMPEP_0113935314 /NCGR_PEP_ID=MMETSP1339-20121228/2471_1 /TAXON_ID=94617 /ORGANISM="Fibrocapsa japonica" /LENGTH=147 /DNA_ID=CAMNT_0000937411 /DNA_START=161 /DNA_END=604 /DNA_ORIENTATION=+ /assembly_acc=CAM_ASM_000762
MDQMGTASGEGWSIGWDYNSQERDEALIPVVDTVVSKLRAQVEEEVGSLQSWELLRWEMQNGNTRIWQAVDAVLFFCKLRVGPDEFANLSFFQVNTGSPQGTLNQVLEGMAKNPDVAPALMGFKKGVELDESPKDFIEGQLFNGFQA